MGQEKETQKPVIVLVAAVAENGVIGREGALPWSLSSDLRYFKQVTLGKPVIMGRKTFQSIGRPLPGRLNIVVSRSIEALEGAEVVSSLDEAYARAEEDVRESGETRICVIGGGGIFAEAMDRADELLITHVEANPEGDAYFPEIDWAGWSRVSETTAPAGERDSHSVRFVVYRRKG